MSAKTSKEFMDKYGDVLKAHPNLVNFLPLLDVHNQESDRGKILTACAFLENQLGMIIKNFLVRDGVESDHLLNGYNAPIGTFSARITLAYLLGTISKTEKEELETLKKIRNHFAHNFAASCDDDKIISLIKLLNYNVPDSSGTSAVSTSSISLILQLVNRSHYVGLEHLECKRWAY